MDRLPTELVVETLSYLPIPSLHAFQLVSRKCREVVLQNESYIYYNAAALHRFAPSTSSDLSSVMSLVPKQLISHIHTWKGFCRTRYLIEQTWMGNYETTSQTTAGDPHRFKGDERRGFVVATHGRLAVHGLTVWSMSSQIPSILWTLPKNYVPRHAHCEYDNGFIIFNRALSLEVWRLISEFNANEIPIINLPDEAQIRSSISAASYHAASFPEGHFVPWALLMPPTLVWAFRFAYPTLASAGSLYIHVWDIPAARLEQSIFDPHLDDVCYIEVNDRYIFVATLHDLFVYSRESGNRVMTVNSVSSLCAPNAVVVRSLPNYQTTSRLIPQETSILNPSDLTPLDSHDHFLAVHVSSCGSHLVVLRRRSSSLVIRNFENFISGTSSFEDSALHVYHDRSSRINKYLAVGEGRFAIASGDSIYVMTFSPEYHLLHHHGTDETRNPIFPHITISKLVCPGPTEFVGLSCLALTRSLLLFNGWDDPQELSIVSFVPEFIAVNADSLDQSESAS